MLYKYIKLKNLNLNIYICKYIYKFCRRVSSELPVLICRKPYCRDLMREASLRSTVLPSWAFTSAFPAVRLWPQDWVKGMCSQAGL